MFGRPWVMFVYLCIENLSLLGELSGLVMFQYVQDLTVILMNKFHNLLSVCSDVCD